MYLLYIMGQTILLYKQCSINGTWPVYNNISVYLSLFSIDLWWVFLWFLGLGRSKGVKDIFQFFIFSYHCSFKSCTFLALLELITSLFLFIVDTKRQITIAGHEWFLALAPKWGFWRVKWELTRTGICLFIFTGKMDLGHWGRDWDFWTKTGWEIGLQLGNGMYKPPTPPSPLSGPSASHPTSDYNTMWGKISPHWRNSLYHSPLSRMYSEIERKIVIEGPEGVKWETGIGLFLPWETGIGLFLPWENGILVTGIRIWTLGLGKMSNMVMG